MATTDETVKKVITLDLLQIIKDYIDAGDTISDDELLTALININGISAISDGVVDFYTDKDGNVLLI